MKIYLLFVFIFLCGLLTVQAQYTSIPESGFEYALIDLGIDSDGEINGRVLTSDIEGVEELNLFGYWIINLAGIEDFTSLKKLYLSYSQDFNSVNIMNSIDLTMVPTLEVLDLSGGSDGSTLCVSHVDLSNNPNLKSIVAYGVWDLESINLKGSDMYIDSLYLFVDSKAQPGFPTWSICVEVINPTDLRYGFGAYANWDILSCYCYFSDNCTLGVADNAFIDLKLYPNPVDNLLHLQLAELAQGASLSIYDFSGKQLQTISINELETTIDVASFASGLYFIKLTDFSGNTQTKQFIKR